MNNIQHFTDQIKFNVRIIEQGDKYGKNDVLIHDKEKPMVEFFDSRYMHTENGQFIGRWYLETIMESHKKGNGLMLDNSCPQWQISASVLGSIVTWAKSQINSTKLKCPNCESTASFSIMATTDITVFGSDYLDVQDNENYEYGEDSPCHCIACGHSGILHDFIEV